ncbi:MAG TPA: universal stress protein [Candidatus Methylomirabilis sp.]|nr:universal stress protein [Candidatus Methylomirabilis sp.]
MIQEHEINQQIKPRPSADPGVSLAKILVATDFSKTSDRALEHALSLARTYNSRIFLAHVIPVDLMMAPELAEAPRDRMRRAAREGMENIMTSGRFFGIPHEEIIEEGYLWPNIEALIKKHEIDLVVLGTHGMGPVRKLLIGSSAEEIFRQAGIPVLTVGPDVWHEPLYGIELKNILLATALGLGAERQAAYAFSLAQQHRSKLTLLHVKQHGGEERAIVDQLRELVPSTTDMHCLPFLRVERGNPVTEILRAAEDTRADLIVIGAKARKGLAGHVPHTKAYQVVCGALCPVLTIKS